MALGKNDQLRAMREQQFAEREAQKKHLAVTNVTNSVTNSVTNVSQPAAASDKARVLRWRQGNQDRYRAYMRDYMRKRREAKKSNG